MYLLRAETFLDELSAEPARLVTEKLLRHITSWNLLKPSFLVYTWIKYEEQLPHFARE